MKPDQYKDNAWLTKRYCIDQLSPREIAQECGVRIRTVQRWIEKHGIHKRSLSEAMLLRTERMRVDVTPELANATYRNRRWLKSKRIKQKLTVREIAEMCHVSGPTICSWLRIRGFKPGNITKGRVTVGIRFAVPKFMRENINEFCRLKKIGRSTLIRELLTGKMLKEGFNPYK